MHILKVSQIYAPYFDRGGPATKVPAVARHLARRGHRVKVVTARYGVPWRSLRSRHDDVEVEYLGYVARFRALTVNPGIVSFCRRHLRQVDVVHIYGLYDLLGPIVAWCCRRERRPYVIEPLGMMLPIGRSRRLKALWHRVAGADCLKSASLLIATSQQECDELIAAGFPRERVVVRENGIDLDEFSDTSRTGEFRAALQIAADEPLLLFLGRLIPRKGADRLIDAFASACPERGVLVLAGPAELPGHLEQLRRRVQQLGLGSRVFFTGPLYGARKKAALADADLFVLPSEYENFGTTAAEAIACGTPVIVGDRCGISRFVDGKAGVVVPPDPTCLAVAIHELLADRRRYDALRDGCADLARALSWPPLIERLESYYKHVVDHAVT